MGADAAGSEKAACHSDLADDDSAQAIQSKRLDPVTLEPIEGASGASGA
jgi:hypothetical protein